MNRWLMFTQMEQFHVDRKRHLWSQDASPQTGVKRGDFVYLVLDGNVPYATGNIEIIEPHGEMWRVTVSQQFGHAPILREDLQGNSAWPALLARAGAKNSIFVELTPKEIIALNRILRSKGFNAPEDDSIDTRLYLAAEKHDLISVLFLDLDKFGQVNKNYSHSVGDQVILETIEVVRKLLPESGLVQRAYTCGDEMKVLLPGLNEEMALDAAEHIRSGIEDNPFSVVGRGKLTVTIGLATYPDTCDDLDRLFLEADEAHGRAKTKYLRNSVTTCKQLLDDSP